MEESEFLQGIATLIALFGGLCAIGIIFAFMTGFLLWLQQKKRKLVRNMNKWLDRRL